MRHMSNAPLLSLQNKHAKLNTHALAVPFLSRLFENT